MVDDPFEGQSLAESSFSGGDPGSRAAKDYLLEKRKPEIQKLYDVIRANEDEITAEMNKIASDLGIKMV